MSFLKKLFDFLLNPHGVKATIQPKEILEDLQSSHIIEVMDDGIYDDENGRVPVPTFLFESEMRISYSKRNHSSGIISEVIFCSMPKAHRTVFGFRNGKLVYTEYSSGGKYPPPDDTYRQHAKLVLTRLKNEIEAYTE